MTAYDPLTGAEILHWLNSGAPDGWSWPLHLDPWDLVSALASALAAVLDLHQNGVLPSACDCYDGLTDCPTRAAIATAFGLDT